MDGTRQAAMLAPDETGIARAAATLRDGGLVAVPTETVYGLAARADSVDAVASIYRAKGRPSFNPLIVHVAGVEAAAKIALFDDRSMRMAEHFWPGPLTMVLPLREDAKIAASVTAGLPSVALRCPAHPVMRALLEESGLALAAPSANRSGAVSPTTAAHVAQSLGGKVDCILDGGACPVGLESTIVALRGDGTWQVLRPGPVTESEIAAVLGSEVSVPRAGGGVEAPGQLASHYSPGKPLRLGVMSSHEDEFHIGFGAVDGDVNLSASGDFAEAAAHLYEALHRAAESGRRAIAVAPIPEQGMGTAINDRLRRAAV